MPLILDNTTQNISTDSGDTGTYSWSDIYALGSSNITKTGNVYFCDAQIDLVTTSTLNIDRENIEIRGTGYINGKINITGSRIIISAQYLQAPRYLSLGKLGTVIDSIIVLRATDQYTGMSMDFDYFTNSFIIGENFNSAGSDVSRRLNLLTGTSKNLYVKNITEIVFTSSQTRVDGLSLVDVNDGIVNFNTFQTINIYNYSSLGTTRLNYKVGQGSFRFINSPDVVLSKGGILNPNSPSFGWGGQTPTVFQAVSHFIKIVDSLGSVSGASINYSGYTNINVTSASDGSVSEIILDVENTNQQNNIQDYNQNSSGTVPSLTTVTTPDYVRIIKSYKHKELIENFTLTKSSWLGSTTNSVSILLEVDSGVTQTNTTTVLNYTGINHTSTTITITGNRTLEEIYDSRKLYWRNTIGVNAPYLEGNILNLNGANLIVDGVNLVTGNKFKSIKTTGTITYLNNGNTSFPTKDANGFRFKIYGLPTKINSLPVIRVKRISNNTITNPTVVNGEIYIYLVEGEDYEIRADARGFIASNFITINTNTSSELQITLKEILDSNNNPVYGNGITQEKDLITYDNATNTIFIAYDTNYPTISIFSAVDKLEEILATTAGLEIPMHPVYENGKLVFIRNILTNAQSTIKIKPLITNTGDPELLFELVREGDEKPYNLFDFSNSNGRIIKYPTTVNVANFTGEVTVNSTQIANDVWSATPRTLTTYLSSNQQNQLNNLDVAVSTRLAATSYLQAPTTAQIRTEIESSTVLAKEATTASRASQTSVNLIPTTTVLTTDSRLNNLDTTISSRLASTSYVAPLTNTQTTTAVTNALNTKDVVTNTSLNTALNNIEISGLNNDQNNKLTQISNDVLKLKKLRGLSGVSVIAKAPTNTTAGYLRTEDNEINLVITKNNEEEILSGN